MRETQKWRRLQIWRLPQKEDLNNKDNLKNEDDLKNENYLKNVDELKNCPPLQKLKSIAWIFSWDMGQLILNRKCYQVSKPKMEFNMKNIIYLALRMCMHPEKTTFSCKDDFTLTKHTWRWTYSALRYFLVKNEFLVRNEFLVWYNSLFKLILK